MSVRWLASVMVISAVVSCAPPSPREPEPAPLISQAEAAPADCPFPDTGFDCAFQRRFAAAQAYAATRPGTVGIVLRDRATGAVWRNEHAEDLTWTASTIKLAMVVDLYTRQRAGTVRLSASDRTAIDAMLHSSDDHAAKQLWVKYSGRDHQVFNTGFPTYGMTSLRPVPGFGEMYPYWGFQKCTASDLERLMSFVLDTLPGDERAHIVDRMRAVDPNQQWGVWGAGPQAMPGTKAGWSDEEGGWVMNSVGFAGPAERYTLAIMNNLAGRGAYDEGRATDTEVARLLFEGAF